MPTVRVLRALAAASAVTVAGSTAHGLAGGVVPPWLVPVLLVATTPVTLVLSGRRLTTGQLLGLLALGQVAVHATAGHDGSAGSTMVLAHVAATTVCLAVVRHGEASAAGVLRLLRDLLGRARVLTCPPVPARAAHPVPTWRTALRPVLLPGGLGGRAPPAAC